MSVEHYDSANCDCVEKWQYDLALAVVEAADGMWAYAIDYASPGTKLQHECNAYQEAKAAFDKARQGGGA